ncbi:MAG TPA: hypothetical protein VGK21_02495, partial [Candidatus Angelobacter sp.]
RRRAAESLKISYRALLYKIRDAGLSPNRTANVKSMAAESSAPVSHSDLEPEAAVPNIENVVPIAKVSNA